jgi:hypothetical protein
MLDQGHIDIYDSEHGVDGVSEKQKVDLIRVCKVVYIGGERHSRMLVRTSDHCVYNQLFCRIE